MNEIDKASVNKTLFDLQQKESRIDRLVTLTGFLIQHTESNSGTVLETDGVYVFNKESLVDQAVELLEMIESAANDKA